MCLEPYFSHCMSNALQWCAAVIHRLWRFENRQRPVLQCHQWYRRPVVEVRVLWVHRPIERGSSSQLDSLVVLWLHREWRCTIHYFSCLLSWLRLIVSRFANTFRVMRPEVDPLSAELEKPPGSPIGVEFHWGRRIGVKDFLGSTRRIRKWGRKADSEAVWSGLWALDWWTMHFKS